jgi:hypothetical protein
MFQLTECRVQNIYHHSCQIEPPPGELNNPNWARTAREIYHKALSIVFEPLVAPSRYGKACSCGDGQPRILFPRVIIISMDLEEQ